MSGSAGRGLEDLHIAVVGMGLMGASLALALRGRCASLLGVDSDPETVAIARERGVVDRASETPDSVLSEVDVVILATPVRAILDVLRALPDLHPGRAVVLDLGSTKRAVVAAMDGLPERFDPLGGHPMCGKETAGIDHADPGMFIDAPFALTPLPRTGPGARGFAEKLVGALGARPLWLDPGTHDRWVAATSHAPYLAAAALSLATPLEAAPLAGPGFRSASRLAGSATSMTLDILLTNPDLVLEAVGRIATQLDIIAGALSRRDEAALEDHLSRAAARRRTLAASPD